MNNSFKLFPTHFARVAKEIVGGLRPP